jgi:hypothetical protein
MIWKAVHKAGGANVIKVNGNRRGSVHHVAQNGSVARAGFALISFAG